jgi:hypothetical protein
MRQVIRRFLKHLAAEKKLWFFESIIYWSVYSVVMSDPFPHPISSVHAHDDSTIRHQVPLVTPATNC